MLLTARCHTIYHNLFSRTNLLAKTSKFFRYFSYKWDFFFYQAHA